AYINALFILGWAMGGFAWGFISDKIGRKKSLLLSIGCYGLFTLLTGFMHNWAAVILCRFMTGFGVGGLLVTSVTILSEVWPHKTKAIYLGILSISFPVGIFSAGLINYIVSSWREGFLIGSIPVLLAVTGVWLIQESGHWLSDKKETVTEENKFRTMFSNLHSRDLINGSIIFGTMLIGLWAIFSWMPTWVQSIVSGGDAHKERGLSMMLLGMGGLAGGFFSGWMAKAIGLRRSMTLCFAACSIASFLLFKTNRTFSPVVYMEIAVLSVFFGASQGILSVYIPQLFPTLIRATATGFCFNIGRIFTAMAVLFVGVLVTVLGGYGNALLIFSMIFILGLFVVLFTKQT
nr:MFS transporter [Chitinophagaceae bacterium]